MPSRADEMVQVVNTLASALYGRNGRNGGGPPEDKKGGSGMYFSPLPCLVRIKTDMSQAALEAVPI